MAATKLLPDTVTHRNTFTHIQEAINPYFPSGGYCPRCGRDISDYAIKQDFDPTKWVTGCPFCYKSFVD